MAISTLHETLLSYSLMKNNLQNEIGNLQVQKSLLAYSRKDFSHIKARDEKEVRDFFKALYEGSEDYQGKYKDYTQIPDFEEEMDKIAAEYQDKLEEAANYETDCLDARITTASAQIEEINAYTESFKSMLSSNIQEDFKLKLT